MGAISPVVDAMNGGLAALELHPLLCERADLGALSRLERHFLPFARRISFLIDKTGCVALTYPNVNPSQHARAVLRDAARLT